MRAMRQTIVTLILLAAPLAAAPASALDRTLWAEVLERHTRASDDTAGTRVDYAALRDGPGAETWRRLVASLEASDPAALSGREARLAFWIDAYNILAIHWVVREGPLDSIRDVGIPLVAPVWKKTAGRIGGREVTLHEIEHEILRPMGDPRIHAAIVCASTSCPSLRREPYRPERIDAQLDDAARRFLADPSKGLAVDRDAEVVRLSKIFDWFAEDFGGREGVLDFVVAHAPPDASAWIAAQRSGIRIRHFDYDWSLNAVAGGA